MNNDNNESNRNENHIYHCILSWCSEHKMKLLLGVLLIGLIGTMIFSNDDIQCDKIDLELTLDPLSVQDKGTSVLKINITPLQDFTDSITIEIKPQSMTAMEILKDDNLVKEDNRYVYKLDIDKYVNGESFTKIFNINAKSDCKDGRWTIDVIVTVGETCKKNATIDFVVEEPQPKNGGTCLGSLFIAIGILSILMLRKENF